MAHFCLKAQCPNRVSLGSASDEGSIDLLCARFGRSYYRSARGKTIGVTGLVLIGLLSIAFFAGPLIVKAIRNVKENIYPALSDSQLWLQEFEEKYYKVVSVDSGSITDIRYVTFRDGLKSKIDARKDSIIVITDVERKQLEDQLNELKESTKVYLNK